LTSSALRQLRPEPESAVAAEAQPDPIAAATALMAAGDRPAGLAMLRGLPAQAPTRAEAVAITLRAAAADPEFQELVRQADAARDARDFALGEYLYRRCLELYPLHHGYLTQYGHCLKEQGKTENAEAVYRSALALGGPPDDLLRHIAAVAPAGAPAPLGAPATAAEDPLDLAPTRDDLRLLLALLLHRGPASPAEEASLLRRCPTRRDLALALIREDAFARANRDLMVLLAETA
jgi:tetratricopeptide (TPR) repeat protein